MDSLSSGITLKETGGGGSSPGAVTFDPQPGPRGAQFGAAVTVDHLDPEPGLKTTWSSPPWNHLSP